MSYSARKHSTRNPHQNEPTSSAKPPVAMSPRARDKRQSKKGVDLHRELPTINRYDPALEAAARATRTPYGAVQVDGMVDTVRSYELGEMATNRYDGTKRQDAYVDNDVLFAERQAQRHAHNYAESGGSRSVAAALDLLDTAARE